MRRSIVFATMLCLLCLSGVALGATIYVPGDQPGIQAGINAAINGDVVMVADGVYTGGGNVNLDFNGKAITVRSASDDPSACIIDCENAGNTRGFYFHNSETSSSVVRGLTIRNGRHNDGGGIYCRDSSSPTITNCAISGNTASDDGGGIYCYYASPTITNCTISENAASDDGGGIWRHSSSTTITNCTITENTATDKGGGIYCGGSSATITDCTISENAANSGGGIYCGYSSSPTITNCGISGNTANGSGGGIYCGYSSFSTITNCTISGNTALYDGGGIYCGSSSLLTITNCAISENAANWGGGIYCDSSSPLITNCTITGNSANYGGGICCWSSSSPTIANCILWGDSATDGNEIYRSGGSPTANHCDIEGGCPPDVACSNCIYLDPLFVTGPDGDEYLSHIAAGDPADSPCINSGNDDASNICFPGPYGMLCMDELTTRADETPDSGTVDIGFHYPISSPTPTPTPTSTFTPINTPTPTPTVPAGDDCSDPVPINCSDRIDGDTSTVFTDTWSEYPCSGRTESGPDVIYELNITECIDAVTARLANTTSDLDVFIISGDCASPWSGAESCAFGDTGATLAGSLTLSDSVWIIVDGNDGASGGYSLEINCAIGDVDGDGATTPGDAFMALQLYLGVPVPGSNETAADICPRPCGDGGIDPGDAYGVLREYLGMPPCG